MAISYQFLSNAREVLAKRKPTRVVRANQSVIMSAAATLKLYFPQLLCPFIALPQDICSTTTTHRKMMQLLSACSIVSKYPLYQFSTRKSLEKYKPLTFEKQTFDPPGPLTLSTLIGQYKPWTLRCLSNSN